MQTCEVCKCEYILVFQRRVQHNTQPLSRFDFLILFLVLLLTLDMAMGPDIDLVAGAALVLFTICFAELPVTLPVVEGRTRKNWV